MDQNFATPLQDPSLPSLQMALLHSVNHDSSSSHSCSLSKNLPHSSDLLPTMNYWGRIATDKKIASSLVDTARVGRIEEITPGSGFVYSGMGPDYRVLVRKARKSSQAYYRTYREIQPVSALVKQTAGVMQEYTQSGGVRPFGVSLLVAGFDD